MSKVLGFLTGRRFSCSIFILWVALVQVPHWFAKVPVLPSDVFIAVIWGVVWIVDEIRATHQISITVNPAPGGLLAGTELKVDAHE